MEKEEPFEERRKHRILMVDDVLSNRTYAEHISEIIEHNHEIKLASQLIRERTEHLPGTPCEVRTGLKVRRNDPCVCGSGKKFKHCCYA